MLVYSCETLYTDRRSDLDVITQHPNPMAHGCQERQAQSGARDMLRSLGLSREPSPEGESLSELGEGKAGLPGLGARGQGVSRPT